MDSSHLDLAKTLSPIIETGLYEIICFPPGYFDYVGHVCAQYLGGRQTAYQPIHFKKIVDLSELFHRHQFYIEKEGQGRDQYHQRYVMSNEGNQIGVVEGKVCMQAGLRAERWRFIPHLRKNGRTLWRIYDDKYNNQWVSQHGKEGAAITCKSIHRKQLSIEGTNFEIVPAGESKIDFKLVETNYNAALRQRSIQILRIYARDAAKKKREEAEMKVIKERQRRNEERWQEQARKTNEEKQRKYDAWARSEFWKVNLSGP